MMQLFHPAFRHLWYLTGLALVGLLVLGYAYEKLSGNTSGVALLGLTASIVHASAWWFTMGPAPPLKKFLICLLLFAGAMVCTFLGRCAFRLVADQPFAPLLENLKVIGGVVPAWWLSIAIVDGVLKEGFRWRLNYVSLQISPRTSLANLFQLTAIVGAVLAFSIPTVLSLVDTDYATILIVSLVLNLVVIIPLSLLILKAEIAATPFWAILKIVPMVALTVLFLLAISKMFSNAIEGVADVAIGLITLTAPYLFMLLMTHENLVSVSSGWFEQE